MTGRVSLGLAAAPSYVLAIIAANALTSRYGLVPVGFTLNAPAGVYCAGLALMIRNQLQDALGRAAVVLAIAVGASVSAAVASPALAVASGTAFGISEIADTLLYTPLRRRGWVRAVTAASLLGAVLDTMIFLPLAHFPLTPSSISGQLLGKTWALWVPVLAVVALRARRHPHVA